MRLRVVLSVMYLHIVNLLYGKLRRKYHASPTGVDQSGFSNTPVTLQRPQNCTFIA